MSDILPFVCNHKAELTPIAKPSGTRAKAFRYVNPAQKVQDVQNTTHHSVQSLSEMHDIWANTSQEIYDVTATNFLRRLRFLQSPDWSHH